MDESTEYICLRSADEHEFIVAKNCAMQAGTIRAILSGSGDYTEKATNTISFREISSATLEKVCCYFYYRTRYNEPGGVVPEFPIEPEIALDLLMAANFLDT